MNYGDSVVQNLRPTELEYYVVLLPTRRLFCVWLPLGKESLRLTHNFTFMFIPLPKCQFRTRLMISKAISLCIFKLLWRLTKAKAYVYCIFFCKVNTLKTAAVIALKQAFPSELDTGLLRNDLKQRASRPKTFFKCSIPCPPLGDSLRASSSYVAKQQV